MGGWFLSIAMAQYIAGIIAAVASGGEGGHAEAASTISQYSTVYWQLFILGLVVGGAYLLFAPKFDKLMHGVK
jgi:POT family proton-dependent oligopeptide transporter